MSSKPDEFIERVSEQPRLHRKTLFFKKNVTAQMQLDWEPAVVQTVTASLMSCRAGEMSL